MIEADCSALLQLRRVLEWVTPLTTKWLKLRGILHIKSAACNRPSRSFPARISLLFSGLLKSFKIILYPYYPLLRRVRWRSAIWREVSSNFEVKAVESKDSNWKASVRILIETLHWILSRFTAGSFSWSFFARRYSFPSSAARRIPFPAEQSIFICHNEARGPWITVHNYVADEMWLSFCVNIDATCVGTRSNCLCLIGIKLL